MKLTMMLLTGLGAGVGLGWIYFQTLWLTVAHLPETPRPGLWIASSLFLRLAMMLGAFVTLSLWGCWTGTEKW